MTVGSLFAGIGGFDLGFERAGFTVRWQVESDDKAQKVLKTRFPGKQLEADIELCGAWNLDPMDVLVGGFPCQDVSVAGQRKGIRAARSGLFFEFVRVIDELRPRWVVLENVPGLLSNAAGADFAAVLAAVVDLGYGVVWRILDSRYFGVAQRRRRVFLICRAGTAGVRPTQILLESASGAGRVEAGDQAGADVAATLRGRSAGRGVNEPGRGGEDDSNLVAIGVHANQRGELRTSPVSGSLNGSKSSKQFEGVAVVGGASWPTVSDDESPTLTGRRADQTAVFTRERARALVGSMHKRHDDDTDTLIATLRAHKQSEDDLNVVPTLTGNLGHHGYGSDRGDGSQLVANTLLAPNGGQRTDDLNQTFTATLYGVRRLTPLECERVQGFPDGWTCLCGAGQLGSQRCRCPDTQRYKQLGNAVTVPVAQWIAERIKAAEAVEAERH